MRYGIELELPDWAQRENEYLLSKEFSLEDRMAQVIRFSRLNLENRTGGPFAAGIFQRDTGRPLIIGVNVVEASGYSGAHAEMMAISLGQRALGSWDLGGEGMEPWQLVVNWRPCAMCYGAVIWSGIRSLAIAGSGPELEEITGFDEGPLRKDWRYQLESRGIEVIDGILREQALEVFHEFALQGSNIYNARQGQT